VASLKGCNPVILHDEIDTTDPAYVQVQSCLNPYLQRWVVDLSTAAGERW
jgi:hypothetical protein